MAWLLAVPFLVQAALMAADEFRYHHRRGLPRWERVGHPLDTVTVLTCYTWILLAQPHGVSPWVFAALAAFSSLFVTKDEFVHARLCGGEEHWVHALLFAVHPFVLASAGFIWPLVHGARPEYLRGAEGLETVLYLHMAATFLFLLYQIIYWNFVWKPDKAATAG